MRFEGILEYHIDTDERINTNEQTLPPMLLQPYVENAIRHGLFHRRQNRQLYIRFIHTETGIRIEIEDNGIGRKKSEELNRQRMKTHQSFSMQANRKRIDILRQQQPGIQLTIVDLYTSLQEPAGTRVVIELPRTMR
jgi:LytS/YehU family sensor histidine kinase